MRTGWQRNTRTKYKRQIILLSDSQLGICIVNVGGEWPGDGSGTASPGKFIADALPAASRCLTTCNCNEDHPADHMNTIYAVQFTSTRWGGCFVGPESLSEAIVGIFGHAAFGVPFR